MYQIQERESFIRKTLFKLFKDMRRLFNYGLTSIFAGFVPLVIKDVYEPTKYYLVQQFPELTSTPTAITQLSVIVGVIIGSVLITNDKYHWIQKLSKASSNRMITYDDKKLNNEIFRKLMRVECLESWFFFIEKVGFCIPTNSKAFLDKSDSEYMFWKVGSRDPNLWIDEFKPIQKVIHNLEIGEKYLQKYYSDNYMKWDKIKRDVQKLNDDRVTLFNTLSHEILTSLKNNFKLKKHNFEKIKYKEFDFKPKIRLDPWGDGWAYFQDNMPIVLPLLLNDYNMKFDFTNPHENQYYVEYKKYRLVGVNDREKITVDECKYIFRNTVQNQKYTQKIAVLDNRLNGLNEKCSEFGDELEKNVVNEIDSML